MHLRLILAVCLCSALACAQSPVPPGAVLQKIAGGFKFVEGPVWNDSLGLLFSDIQGNSIYRWSPSDSAVSVYMRPSDSSNGLAYDRVGRLVLTQMAKRRLARREADGSITVLAPTYNGKRFNSPNDVVVRSDGSIFFTDPDFNTPVGQPKELSFRGIYRISPAGTLYLLDSTFDKPNGICFSPDEKKLYVNESPLCRIYVWDVVNDSTIAGKKLLYTLPASGYADGMKVDPSGNIFCAGPGGIWVISPSGVYLTKITTPETPTNCAWGEKDRRTLYVTAGTSLYRIRMSTTGVDDEPGARTAAAFRLNANYPNPFNPSTMISYELPRDARVSVEIFDVLGRRVSTLLDEHQSAGAHQVRFESGMLPSGIYLCRVRSGGFSAAQKLVLLR